MGRGQRPAVLRAAGRTTIFRRMRRISIGLAVLAVLLGVIAILWWGRAPEAPSGDVEVDEAEATAVDAAAVHDEDRPGIDVEPVELTVEAGEDDAILSGHVVDDLSGKGVGRAELTFMMGDGAHSVTSDAHGEFRFVTGMPGLYRLVGATAPGYAPLGPGSGRSGMTFDARPGVRVSGARIGMPRVLQVPVRVVERDGGAPVPGAKVIWNGAALLGVTTRPALTDAAGEASIAIPMDADVEVRAAGFLSQEKSLFLPAEVESSLEEDPATPLPTWVFELVRGTAPPEEGWLAGVVLDPDGGPLADAQVTAHAGHRRRGGEAGPADANAPRRSTLSGSDGRFRLEGLVSGPHTLLVVADGFAPHRQRGVTPNRDDLEIRLATRVTLRGQVTDARNGAPITSFSVLLARPRSNSPGIERFFAPDGRYEISGLRPGPLRLQATAFGFAMSRAQEITLGSTDVELNFALTQGGSVTGKVIDEESRAPIAGASVSTEGRLDLERELMPVTIHARTDASGTFEVRGVSEGLRSLEVSAAGHHTRLVSGLAIESDGHLGPLTIELAPRGENEEPALELTGIGATLERKDDGLRIMMVMPLGGADSSGLVPGDLILAIDGESTTRLSLEDSVERIRGMEGTTVTLRVRRADGSEQTLTIERRRVRAG